MAFCQSPTVGTGANNAGTQGLTMAQQLWRQHDITSLSGLTTALSVGQGGTGGTTFTLNGVIFGNGTSALQTTSAGSPGQVLIANASNVPTDYSIW